MTKTKSQKKNNEKHELSADGARNYRVMGQSLSTATCFDYQVVVHS